MTDLGRPVPAHGSRPGFGQESGHGGATDLTELVAAVRAAAERIQVTAAPSPWLPPLPDQITVSALEVVQAASPVAVPLGLADHPSSQAQTPFVVDLEQAGPVVVAGMGRSGRSTVLRILAASVTARTSPADVHIYILDYGRALAPLSALPHCGACVHGDESDQAERLLDLLTAEATRRTRLLSASGYASLREQRSGEAPASRLPYVLVLIDRYEAFLARHAEADGGRLVEALDALLRRGAAAGITAVVATDRSGFTHRLGSVAASRLVLRQANPDDMAAFGAVPRETSMPPGRAVFVPAGTEVQVALLAPDPEGAAQAAAVEELATVLMRRWDSIGHEALPHRIDPLPVSITMTELAVLRVGPRPRTPTLCTVGAGGDHLAPVDVDLADAGSAFLVSGPPRSGRSAALGALVTSLSGRLSGEMSVLICCPRPSPLTELAQLSGVAEVLHGPELAARLEDAIADVSGRFALVIDDAELVAEGLAASVLEQVVRTIRDSGNLVIAAGTTDDLILQRFRGWLATIRRGRCGLLLNPSSYVDGEVFDIRLPRSTCGGWPPGRGLLVERGSAAAVQVPLPSPEAVLPSRPGQQEPEDAS